MFDKIRAIRRQLDIRSLIGILFKNKEIDND